MQSGSPKALARGEKVLVPCEEAGPGEARPNAQMVTRRPVLPGAAEGADVATELGEGGCEEQCHRSLDLWRRVYLREGKFVRSCLIPGMTKRWKGLPCAGCGHFVSCVPFGWCSR